jgi:hypothetical protein
MLTVYPFSLLKIVTVPYFWFASEVGECISDAKSENRMIGKRMRGVTVTWNMLH